MNTRKLTVGVGALAVAVGLTGYGVFAQFTDTESSNVALDTGQLDIVGAGDITITNVAPGDISFRDIGVDLPDASNDGDLVRAIRVSVPAGYTDTLGAQVDTGDVDTPVPAGQSLVTGADGIQVILASCVGGTWTLPAANAALAGDADSNGLDNSATCSGTINIVQTSVGIDDLANGANTYEFDAAALGITASPTGTIPDGTSLELIAQFRLPTTAGNGYENASTSFDLRFDAIQRAGVNR